MGGELSRELEEQWCAEQRQNVLAYLAREKCPSASVGEWPAWHVAPHLSVWAVESLDSPGCVGWWAVSGDIPTDYVECGLERHPRQALRDIGLRWREAARNWLVGKSIDGFQIGDGSQHRVLAPMLAQRAETLLTIAADDENWAN